MLIPLCGELGRGMGVAKYPGSIIEGCAPFSFGCVYACARVRVHVVV